MQKRLLALAILAGLTLTACSINITEGGHSQDSKWREAQRFNAQQIAQLTNGAGIEQVRAAMGQPDFTESFSKEGSQIVVLFYRTHHRRSDGITTKDECTPLVFRDGRLTGWGDKAYQYL